MRTGRSLPAPESVELGVVVDPEDPADLHAGIVQALRQPRGVPDGLDYFSYDRYVERWHALVQHELDPSLAPANPPST